MESYKGCAQINIGVSRWCYQGVTTFLLRLQIVEVVESFKVLSCLLFFINNTTRFY